MATIMDLPDEIIFIILENANISIKDIVNFSSTCWKFIYIADYILWKKKFVQRWPIAKASYKEKMGVEFYHANIEDVKDGIKCARKMKHYVSRMSEMYYYCKDRYSNKDIFMKDIETLFLSTNEEKHSLNFFFLFDELIRRIYKQDPRQCNLTERYYSIQIFQCLNRHIFKSKWQELENTLKEPRLEDIIVMILQWYHPDKIITDLLIDEFMDNFVQQVLKSLKDKNPAHPILSISSEQFSVWKNNNIDKNYWNEENANSIKRILDETIIKFDSYKLWMELNQIDNIDTYCYKIHERKFRYKYLLWLIIYTCVARRLGLYFEISMHCPYTFYLHFHLIWKPRNDTETIEYFTFNLINDKSNIKISDITKRKKLLNPIDLKISLKLITDILMEILGYYCLWPMDVNPFREQISSSMRFYDVSICTPPDEKVCKIRSPNLKYAVGLIVRHKHYGSDIAGVIIGWHNMCQIERFKYPDTCCTPNKIADVYMLKYNVHNNWKLQPSYVLLIDNDLCYVPQSAITSVCTSEWINNSDIGKYFCKFEDTHYVPNKMLEKHYPNDAAVVCKILSSNKL